MGHRLPRHLDKALFSSSRLPYLRRLHEEMDLEYTCSQPRNADEEVQESGIRKAVNCQHCAWKLRFKTIRSQKQELFDILEITNSRQINIEPTVPSSRPYLPPLLVASTDLIHRWKKGLPADSHSFDSQHNHLSTDSLVCMLRSRWKFSHASGWLSMLANAKAKVVIAIPKRLIMKAVAIAETMVRPFVRIAKRPSGKWRMCLSSGMSIAVSVCRSHYRFWPAWHDSSKEQTS